MVIGEWIGLGSLLLTNVGTVYLTYNNFSRKINRIYERLDEVKDNTEKEFVRKDSCSLMHNQTADNLRGVEIRMEKRIDKLETTVIDNFKEIVKLLNSKQP